MSEGERTEPEKRKLGQNDDDTLPGQFLIGLNESFDHIRNQILVMDPLPTINKPYLMVLRVEKQKEVHITFTENIQNTAMFAKAQNYKKEIVGKKGYKMKDMMKKSERHCTILKHALSSIELLDSRSWIIETGASSHMCVDLEIPQQQPLISYRHPLPGSFSYNFTNNSQNTAFSQSSPESFSPTSTSHGVSGTPLSGSSKAFLAATHQNNSGHTSPCSQPQLSPVHTAFATSFTHSDPMWYMDSRAIDHVTTDLNHMSISKNYDGVSQLQDRLTKATLLQGELRGGLYQLNIPHSNSAHSSSSSSSYPGVSKPYLPMSCICNNNSGSCGNMSSPYPNMSAASTLKNKSLSCNSAQSMLYNATKCKDLSINNNKTCSSNFDILCFNADTIDIDYMIWHKLLGHPHSLILQKIVAGLSKNTISKSKSSSTHSLSFCDARQLGELHLTSFPPSTSQATAPLELIHSDVWGPAPLPSLEDGKIVVTPCVRFNESEFPFSHGHVASSSSPELSSESYTSSGQIQSLPFPVITTQSPPSSTEQAPLPSAVTSSSKLSENGTLALGNKWAFRTKYNVDGSLQKYKARLVAKGFQQTPGLDNFETFSPVVKPSTIRIILTLAIMHGWDVQQIDVNNAFLNGTSNEELKAALLSKGFVNSVSDSSLFIFKHNSLLIDVLVYVDDIILIGSSSNYITQLLKDLNDQFSLKTLGSLHYFLGLEATRNCSGIHLKQTKYAADLLLKTRMNEAYPCSTPMAIGTRLFSGDSDLFEQSSLYRSTIGALQYLILTRPDLSFPVNKLKQFLSAPITLQWQACKRILRYVKGTLDYGLHFQLTRSLYVECYAIADWGSNLEDRRSTSGCCVYMGPNLVQWSSRKQQVVALSSTEAKYRALAQTATEVAWLQSLFTELGIFINLKPVIWCDNISPTALASNPIFHACTKHI
ncbi:uncharacterized protein LOC116138690 [Pistacia vera]|uniref:uncharacterized protein LOC116138690 n=1 Tax=Pistacia vera TaxID=55513 RepID=UPI001262F8CE|nr:uncharacterized protein LOC116138690 [Pistacia vera]